MQTVLVPRRINTNWMFIRFLAVACMGMLTMAIQRGQSFQSTESVSRYLRIRRKGSKWRGGFRNPPFYLEFGFFMGVFGKFLGKYFSVFPPFVSQYGGYVGCLGLFF